MKWIQNIQEFMASQSRLWLMVEAVVLVLVVGVFDYATGYEVAFYPFYSIPILVALWFGGITEAVYISVLSSVVWWCVDRAVGHVYSYEWLRFWDSVVRLMFFCLVVAAGSAFRRQRDSARARIELLERSRKLEQEIISISEREQQRIGQDLHDSLGQYLVAIGFAADALKRDLKNGLARVDAAGEIAGLIHNAVVRARDLARGLSPVDQDEGGLESALEQLAQSVSRLTGIECRFSVKGNLQACENSRVTHLFRIAQEAVNNAVKHASPDLIEIRLETNDDGLLLSVYDDGVGFPSEIESSGMGLNIMKYRAKTIGATLEIHPDPKSGTVVTCEITGLAFNLLKKYEFEK